jgi:hypothetical protein
MLRRIGLWALCGSAVALVWALVFYVLGPSSGHYPSQFAVLQYLSHSAVLAVTVPLVLLGQHWAITWYSSLLINAVMYAMAGLVVELILLPFRGGSARLRH